ncbi:uncharacterized protein LOC131948225 [Physella acuta]|uniref:uncharacterized protein LOC131948225 n=1 Tax=Physella acuta TaxID=109671 RepID=UPI0027DDCB2B|nr:uncharacterized protein LOC131948225 [Physella acuta]
MNMMQLLSVLLLCSCYAYQVNAECSNSTPPVIREKTNATKFVSLGDYTLLCVTDCTEVEWLKDDLEIENITSTEYAISNATANDNGNYTCRITVNETSAAFTFIVDINVPGKPCKTNEDCRGKEYTGTCSNFRCSCAATHHPEGVTCLAHNSASAILNSALLVIGAVLAARLVMVSG